MGNSIWTRYYPEIPIIDTFINPIQISALRGDSSTKTFSIRNIGNDTLIVDSIKESNPYSINLIPSSLPESIPPQDTLLTTISLNPNSIKFYYDTLLVFSNDAYRETLWVNILGRSTGNIRLSEYSHNFRTIPVWDTASWDFWAHNPSADTLTIDSIINLLSVYWYDPLNFPRELIPGESLQIL